MAAALEAVKAYFVGEGGPLEHDYEQGDIGCGDTWEPDFDEVVALATATDDNLGGDMEVTEAVRVYRMIVDALSEDGGAARKAAHKICWWAEGRRVCLTCGRDWDGEDEDPGDGEAAS